VGVEHTADYGQPLKIRQVFDYPSLKKRGQGRFFAHIALIVPEDSPRATKNTSPPPNQIPLDPPFPKGEKITTNHLPLTPVFGQEDVTHDWFQRGDYYSSY